MTIEIGGFIAAVVALGGRMAHVEGLLAPLPKPPPARTSAAEQLVTPSHRQGLAAFSATMNRSCERSAASLTGRTVAETSFDLGRRPLVMSRAPRPLSSSSSAITASSSTHT